MAERASEEDFELPWAPCIAIELEEADAIPVDSAGAPVYSELRWTEKELGSEREIRVFFMQQVPSGCSLSNGENISKETILTWANVWSSKKLDMEGKVPKFVEESEYMEDSHVRVVFTSK